jgi:ABC-2 type transport system permease protein
MLEALHAEWTKLRTLPSTLWLVLAATVLTVAVSAGMVLASTYQSIGYQDTTKLSLTGIYLGQAVIAIFAVLVISNEYSTGMMRLTLIAVPRRLLVLAAKATTLMGIVVVSSVIAVAGSLVAGRLILPGRGFTAAHGYPVLSLAHGATLRAAGGSLLYLVLIALLSLGVACAVRDSAAAIGVVLGLLYVFPLLDQVVSDPAWHRHLEQIGPMTAGLSVQATTGLQALPISPWAGVGVLAGWAGAALVIGGLLLQRRDA